MRLTTHNSSAAEAILAEATAKYFKILFKGYKIEDAYQFSTIDSVKHPRKNRLFGKNEKAELLRAFCDFIEKATSMTCYT